MALTLQQQYEIAIEATFKNRVALALAGYADDVMAEDQSAMTGVDYNGRTEAEARTNMAYEVLRDAPGVANRLKFYLAAKGAALTIPGGTTIAQFVAGLSDAQYSGFISSNWSQLAGWRESDIVSP